jgi:transcriptional regulator with XRE-family HTH domain
MTERRLATILRDARLQRDMSLRDVERATGIRSGHLSQLETGTIAKPEAALLWTLADVYGLAFEELLRHAGHSTERGGGQSFTTALRALSELTEEERRDVLRFMADLKRRRHA